MASVDVTQLARKLLALEARGRTSGDTSQGASRGGGGGGGEMAAAVGACENLRIPLSKLAGPVGFATLLSRALALATAQAPALAALQVRPDGSIETIGHEHHGNSAAPPDHSESGVVLTAQLLGLLVTFIGEPLTIRLVQEAWPQLSPGDIYLEDEAAP